MLEQRMLAQGWCPLDVRRTFFDHSMCIYEQYYLSKMQNTDKTISHSNCTEFDCRGRNINKATYRQLHTRTCDAKCGGFQYADLDQLTEIIKDGDIPVFKWNFASQKLELTEVQVNEHGVGQPPFMAISHV
jgi:hypothetical protein